MLKLLALTFALNGFFFGNTFAETNVASKQLLGIVEGPATGDIKVQNPYPETQFTTLIFENTGTKTILLDHIRVNEPDDITYVGPERYELAPGASATFPFWDVAVPVESVEFFIHGSTESLAVYAEGI